MTSRRCRIPLRIPIIIFFNPIIIWLIWYLTTVIFHCEKLVIRIWDIQSTNCKGTRVNHTFRISYVMSCKKWNLDNYDNHNICLHCPVWHPGSHRTFTMIQGDPPTRTIHFMVYFHCTFNMKSKWMYLSRCNTVYSINGTQRFILSLSFMSKSVLGVRDS